MPRSIQKFFKYGNQQPANLKRQLQCVPGQTSSFNSVTRQRTQKSCSRQESGEPTVSTFHILRWFRNNGPDRCSNECRICNVTAWRPPPFNNLQDSILTDDISDEEASGTDETENEPIKPGQPVIPILERRCMIQLPVLGNINFWDSNTKISKISNCCTFTNRLSKWGKNYLGRKGITVMNFI